MAEPIENQRVREQLDAATSATSFEEKFKYLADAFQFLLDDFIAVMGPAWPSAFRKITPNNVPDVDFRDILVSLQEVQMITSLGLDFVKYMKFKIICPVKDFQSAQSSGGGKRSEENLTFAIDYVVESALKIQSIPRYGDVWEHVGKPDIRNL